MYLISLTAFAQEPQIGSTYQNVLKKLGKPVFATKTEEGNQVWAYPGQTKAYQVIEFNKDGIVANEQSMSIDELLDLKEEKGCSPLAGYEEWFSWSSKTKLKVVKGFIEVAKENGVIIKQSPEYYAKEVDIVLSGPHNPEIIPLGTALRTIAVMDGDWDDGSGNKLGIASMYLGPGLIKLMREMDPEKYEKLLGESK